MRVQFATRREIRGLERTVSFESFDSFVSCVHSFATDRIRARIHHEAGAHQGAVETPQDEAEKGEREATTSTSARGRDGRGDVDARGRGWGKRGDGRDGGGDERGGGGAAAKTTTTRGRARQSDRARRKRELRDRISELKSKRSKIGKKNFGKSEERKRLTMMIKELERERAAVCADEERGGGGGEDEDDAMMDAE